MSLLFQWTILNNMRGNTMGDLQKTIHYTTESEMICGNLI
jgi:hypothetical protein